MWPPPDRSRWGMSAYRYGDSDAGLQVDLFL
jgi:hypothetical protein